jgi:uncharacterized membrane protein YhfC
MYAQAGLMIALPIVLWSRLIKRLGLGRHGWAAVGYGCLAFLAGIVVSGLLGLGAFAIGATGLAQLVLGHLIRGIGQEGARYALFAQVGQLRERLDRPTAIAFGLGQGGFQSLIQGLIWVAQARIVQRALDDPAAFAQLPPSMMLQVEQLAATPWYLAAAGVLESALGIALYVGLSLVVAAAVRQRRLELLGLAVLWDAVALGGAGLLKDATGSPITAALWFLLAAAAALYYGLKAPAGETSAAS